MAKQDDEKMRGLLFSPEVLGGFGLLSAGLAGKNPSQAFPSMFQGLKTAQLYSKYLTDQKEYSFYRLTNETYSQTAEGKPRIKKTNKEGI